MAILNVVRVLGRPPLDALRCLAEALDDASRDSLLRRLGEIDASLSVISWDSPVWTIEEIVITDGSRRRRLRVDDTGRWTVSHAPAVKRGPLRVQQPRAGDVFIEYAITYKWLVALRARLRRRAAAAGRGKARGRWTTDSAEHELLRLLRWPDARRNECPLYVTGDRQHLFVSFHGKPEDSIPWEQFVAGDFAPANLAKIILATELKWSLRTLRRKLAEARRHYSESLASKGLGVARANLHR